MRGIVLWSDAADQKAVIWCEDEGNLAFLDGAQNVVLPDAFFGIGDLLEFDVQTYRNMRLATNPNHVQQDWVPSPIDSLSAVSAQLCNTVSDSATVIPFSSACDMPVRQATRIDPQKRHG